MTFEEFQKAYGEDWRNLVRGKMFQSALELTRSVSPSASLVGRSESDLHTLGGIIAAKASGFDHALLFLTDALSAEPEAAQPEPTFDDDEIMEPPNEAPGGGSVV